MKSHVFYRFCLLCILLGGMTLALCQCRPPTVESPTSTPSATPTMTPIPQPTFTPLPFPAPRLLHQQPAPGEVQALDAPIELTFDQPMDRDSVEAAFRVSQFRDGKGTATGGTAVKGDLTWIGDRVVRFTPASSLARAAVYRVQVDAAARNMEGTPLLTPITLDLQTVGYLEVSEVQPAPDSQDVDPDTTITVVFNRPVVPLTSVSEQSTLPQPVVFNPPVAGQGEWINTSIYRFRPSAGFAPATIYTARIDAALSDTMDATLAEAYEWTFSTQSPRVLAWSPRSGAVHVDPSGVISITFNQPMDHASAEAAFQLQADGGLVPGTFRWLGGETPLDTEILGFVPTVPLQRGAACTAGLYAPVYTRDRDVPLVDNISWSFTIVLPPGVIYALPFDGAIGIDPYSDVTIAFYSPMVGPSETDRAAFGKYLTISEWPHITPTVTNVYTYWRESYTELRISFPKEPQKAYLVTLDAGVPDRYGAPLGEEVSIRFSTGDLSPYARLETGNYLGTFNAYTDTVVYAAYRNVASLDVALYRLTPEIFMKLYGYGGYDYRNEFIPSLSTLVRRWTVAVSPPSNISELRKLPMVDETGAQLPPGLYYVELSSPEVLAYDPESAPSKYTFVRARVNLALKQTLSQSQVWATDLASGEPVPGLTIRFNDATHGWHGAGVTDDRGLYMADGLATASLWDRYFAFAGQPGDADFAVALSDWDNGISPWDFELTTDFSARMSAYIAYLYTDRPIYRPGQTVYFKGIVRADDDAHYTIPVDMVTTDVIIMDPQGETLYEETLPVSEMGTFFGELALDENVPLGEYYIQMQDPDRELYATTSFRLAEYRKPEYQVDVTPDRDAYLNGDKIAVDVEAAYYFGGAVADAPVNWNLLSEGYSFQYQCPAGQKCPRYSWTDYEWGREWEWEASSYGRHIADGEATTDADGHVLFDVSADIEDEIYSRLFTVEANVTDISGQYVSNRSTVIVHKGEFYVGLAPQGRVVEAGEGKSVDVLVVDWDSQPVPDVPVQVVFMEHRWYSVREQYENGQYYWTWVEEDIPVFTTTVTSSTDGKAVTSFTPTRSGSYRVRATGRDTRGNEIRSSTYIWVWGGGAAYWRRESNNRIDLITDKDEYNVGDVAEILIPSPYTSTVNALVTIERGRIIETQVVELHSTSELLTIPIEEYHAPNIFVSVIIVQGFEQAPDALATFKMGEVLLPVAVEEKELHITLTPDREMETGAYYRPRETATYDVYVTDAAGQPVETELSLRLADLAVLALADERGPTLLEHFWQQRGLGVRTAMPLALAMEAFNRELEPKTKGGGGGGEAEGFVRTNFADTAFWDPVVRTGADGHAQVEVTLPDNLTTWRMQARGITADTRVGRSEVDVRSTLDLLVRPVLPRFFVVGDEAEIATIVHNNTTDPLETEVTLTVDGLTVSGPTRQTVVIPAEGEVKVVWNVVVMQGSKGAEEQGDNDGGEQSVSITMEAREGSFYDGREDELPVYAYSTPEVMATAGRLSEPEVRQEIIQLPFNFDPTQGELTVRVDGSLTAATQDSLDYLEHYPYECVEQTVSRFLPNVLTYQALQELGIARPELEANLTEQVGIAMQRIYSQRHYDGGWGWWVTDESDGYLTAYVLHGLLEAYRAGFTVEEDVIEDGVAYLRQQLAPVNVRMSHWKANRLAYQLYVLGEYVNLMPLAELSGELGRAITLFEYRERLDQYGRATLAVALGLLEPEERSRVDTLLADLVGDAVFSATGAHWEEAQADYWNMSTDVRTTAMVLWALARHNPDSELLPNAVRWLMAVRDSDNPTMRYWESTHTTSWALIALTAYMRATGELQGEFNYQVALNGAVQLEGAVNRDTIDEGQVLQVEVAQLLADEANRLLIMRDPPTAGQSGEGQLYYTAHLRTFLPVDQVQAAERGIVVARQYEFVDRQTGDPSSVNEAAVGDLIRVKLTVVAPNDLYYVVIEDPLPAGCEAVDVSLKTTSAVGEQPTLHNITAEQEDVWYRRYGWGWWYFSHTEMRDEKVALFATYLPRGAYEYTYVMRASVPGTFNVIPATAYEMYFPEVWGRSDGGKFVVTGE
ncbi:MAG: Ig-like domain-containing protein [Anaerolineae bacterium]|nr:Ig-like domain-containing protein [Anaerolineae bacterium]